MKNLIILTYAILIFISNELISECPPVQDNRINVTGNHIRSDFTYGLGLGYGLNHASMNIGCKNSPECPEYNGGYFGGLFFGGSLLWNFKYPYGLFFRADYNYLPFFPKLSMTPKVESSGLFTRDNNGNVVPLSLNHTLEITSPFLSFDLLVNRTFDDFRFFAGPSLILHLSEPEWNGKAKIISPTNVKFPNGQTQYQYLDKDPNNYTANKINLGLTFGMGYDHRINKSNWLISPEISFTYLFNGLYKEYNWKEVYGKLGVSIRYNGNETCGTKDEEKLKIEMFRPLLILNTGKKEDKGLFSFKIEVDRELYPILMSVYFQKNNEMDIFESEQRGSLLQNDYGSYRLIQTKHILDTIGRRMKESANSYIKLTACQDTKFNQNNLNLLSRLNKVKDYLIHSQNSIDGSRIILDSSSANQSYSNPDENNRVDINFISGSDTLNIYKPIYKDSVIKVIETNADTIIIPLKINNFSKNDLTRLKTLNLKCNYGVPSRNIIDKYYDINNYEDKNNIIEANGNYSLKLLFPKEILNEIEHSGYLGFKLFYSYCIINNCHSLLMYDSTELKEFYINKEIDVKTTTRLSSVFFNVRNSELSGIDSCVLRNSIQLLLNNYNPDIKQLDSITISGYADTTGGSKLSFQYAKKRAENTYNFIKKLDEIIVDLDSKKKIKYTDAYVCPPFPYGINSQESNQEKAMCRTAVIEFHWHFK